MIQDAYLGIGSLKNLSALTARFGARRVFLVTGRESFQVSDSNALIGQQLKDLSVLRYSGFSSNPKFEDVQRGVGLFLSDAFDMVIAVGGGSVIDMAKAINIVAAQVGVSTTDIVRFNRITKKGLPLVAIPTTAGSGSEATHFAVVYFNNAKYSVAHEYILPDAVIVDPRLSISMPQHVRAASALDAFCQAIESMWSVNSTDESIEYSRKALSSIYRNFRTALNGSVAGAVAMAEAAFFAGKAINIAKTTAAHALSYPMTAHFGVPHGHAVALTIPELLVFNYQLTESDCHDRRGVSHVRYRIEEICALLGCSTLEKAKMTVLEMIASASLATDLSMLGISCPEHIRLVVENVNIERLDNNPRRLSLSQLEAIVEACTKEPKHRSQSQSYQLLSGVG